MRYAVISDIHSNLEALQEVFNDIERQHVDSILCLGDIVGYGANPNECVALLRERAHTIVAGNHDYAAVDLTPIEVFNPYARSATEWTQKNLNATSAEFLRALPLSKQVDGVRLVHATPRDPEQWRYILHPSEAATELAGMEETLCFIGHSHLPGVFERNGRSSRLRSFGPLTLEGAGRYLVNVGSVGQPRDGNPDAAYVVFDTESASVELHRVPYDIATARSKILAAGLPRVLGDRLERGE
jgi:diadenosine tetraphosphatase ApaH/serine/threonine PP2A family protein phosphatase